ncbi:hypothetical protein BC939DRAFT_506800 [Gamsiella multidivaricata]|uniref:uncharacterized protein n=1 Tax=Gamsiella multidivaricata TaxID=101098 RepID=UPI002220846A|nr:uncharacterized protein BC939DRAFT_506800 [Gamsiella multidivaricata]KAI7818173.1 hypothetical protein BC939DRAFT_506800 [Gamsiella multidivaricata]
MATPGRDEKHEQQCRTQSTSKTTKIPSCLDKRVGERYNLWRHIQLYYKSTYSIMNGQSIVVFMTDDNNEEQAQRFYSLYCSSIYMLSFRVEREVFAELLSQERSPWTHYTRPNLRDSFVMRLNDIAEKRSIRLDPTLLMSTSLECMNRVIERSRYLV